jgi:hypothetical protein
VRRRTSGAEIPCDVGFREVEASAMWTTIKSLDPRTVLAALRRPADRAKSRAKCAERADLTDALQQDWTGAILSYDNVR